MALSLIKRRTESGPGFVRVAGGAHVRGTALWCDVARAGGVSFVARADSHVGRGRADRVIATQETAALCRRLGRALSDPLLPRVGRPLALGRMRLELLPSGRSAGAAQLHVELGGWRGLYAGSVWSRSGPGASALQVRACDELVVDGPSDGVVDDDATIAARLGCADVLHVDDLAVVELLRTRFDDRVRVQGAWHRLQKRAKSDARALRLDPAPRGDALRVVAGRRDASTTDCVALGAGPTRDELVAYVRDTGAARVWVRPSRDGSADPSFVAALVRLGVDAASFGPPEQLSLFGGGRSTMSRNDT